MNKKTLALTMSGVFVTVLGASPIAHADSGSFGLKEFDSSFVVAASEQADTSNGAEKAKEGKCGEGKCGGSKAAKAAAILIMTTSYPISGFGGRAIRVSGV